METIFTLGSSAELVGNFYCILVPASRHGDLDAGLDSRLKAPVANGVSRYLPALHGANPSSEPHITLAPRGSQAERLARQLPRLKSL